MAYKQTSLQIQGITESLYAGFWTGLGSLFLIVGLLGACSGHKKYLDFGKVKDGNYLDRAKEVKLDTFVTFWLENTYPFKLDMNLKELYSDTLFTYFGKQTFRNQDFIKIKRGELRKIDYKSLNGDSIRTKFYHEIIPAEDRKKSEGKNCTSTSLKIVYEYKLIESENIIEIRCHYKVTCEFLIRLIKADYFAKYDLRNRTFKKS